MVGLMRRAQSPALSLFDDDFNTFFNNLDNLFTSFRWPSADLSLPMADIYNQDGAMVVELQAAGFTPDDLTINVNRNVLQISGEHIEQAEDKGKRDYLVRESSRRIARQIALPEGADTEHITAELDNGMLTVHVPVAQPETKRIAINATTSKPKRLEAASKAD